MSLITADLHNAFVRPFFDRVLRHSELGQKPLDLDLQAPLPPRLRVYMYTLVEGGANRRNEYKAVLRVPGQPRGEYGSFEHKEGRFTMLAAYDATLDVFVLWDASIHFRFKNGGNIQVREKTVLNAAATGFARQWRVLAEKRAELVLACQSATLSRALNERLLTTGLNDPNG